MVKATWLLAYAREGPFGGSGPTTIAYWSDDSRSANSVTRYQDGYRGILKVDGRTDGAGHTADSVSWTHNATHVQPQMRGKACSENARPKTMRPRKDRSY